MPSPFPGMNPYLEQPDAWHDFHQQFCIVCRAELVRQLSPNYIVKLEEHLYIHELSSEERRFLGRADVAVKPSRRVAIPTMATLSPPPVVGRVLPTVDVERESFLEIRDGRSGQLITVLELLSPAIKQQGGDREHFLAKRDQLLSSTVHYVEIDLLRRGPRLPIEDLPECDYYAMVSRVDARPDAGLWPLKFEDPLPQIPIPLAAGHPDAALDLQALLHQAYDMGGYETYIYANEPDPPLSLEQRGLARRVLADAGIPTVATTE